MTRTTTIQVSKDVRDIIKSKKRGGDDMNDVILRLLIDDT